MTEFFKKSVKPLRIFSKSMIEVEWYAAFYMVLEEDFKNGKLVLTEDQEMRIDQLFNKRMENFKNGKF